MFNEAPDICGTETILYMVNNKSRFLFSKIGLAAECEFFNIKALHVSS